LLETIGTGIRVGTVSITNKQSYNYQTQTKFGTLYSKIYNFGSIFLIFWTCEDESNIISERFFENYFIPEVKKSSENFKKIGSNIVNVDRAQIIPRKSD